jgi:uncharacterized UPF0160 family protein
MATAILKEIFEIELTRTRDEKILSKLDIVYDVGGGEFDHHDMEKVYRDDGIPYAACGLIWRRFGREVIASKDSSLREEDITSIFNYIDRNLIEGIDALDNGIWKTDGEIPIMNISSIISGFNPLWNSDKDEDEAFSEIVNIVTPILKNVISQRISVIKSKTHVVKAYKNRKIPQLLVLDRYCPYGDSLQEIDEKDEVLFVVYPRKDSYAMQTVRGNNREDKKKLPAAWAGKRDGELASITGVPDAVFCHSGRFIAVAVSQKGIMQLAKLAIEEPVEAEEGKLIKIIKGILSKFK